MWAMLRIVLFEWILARLGLRWLITFLIAVPLALVFFVGIPALLIFGACVFLLWRFLRKRPAQANQSTEPAA